LFARVIILWYINFKRKRVS